MWVGRGGMMLHSTQASRLHNTISLSHEPCGKCHFGRPVHRLTHCCVEHCGNEGITIPYVHQKLNAHHPLCTKKSTLGN